MLTPIITFLPNFIRWAIRYYFRPNAIYTPSRADRGLDQLKNVVRVAMHSKAGFTLSTTDV